MKTKILTIIIAIVLIVAGVIGCTLLLGEKDSKVMVTNKNTNEVNDNKYTESKVEEKINEELEIEQEILDVLLCQKNTYYSVVKNYNNTEGYEGSFDEILDKYCTDYISWGDFPTWLEIESNYEQYTKLWSEDDVEIKKVVDDINIKLAQIHETTCNLEKYNDEMSLEEVVKLQSEEGFDYTGELIGKDGCYEITGMLLMNGNNTSEEEWKNNSRAKKISVIINGEEEYGFDLEDTMEVQVIDLNYRQDGTDKPVDIEIKILETYKGDVSEDVYISDIRFGFDSSIRGGR